MKLLAFRIESFRSVADTGWHEFSPDNVSVLVGQNESGKSSILEALSFAASYSSTPKVADLRSDGSMPRISVRIRLSAEDVSSACTDRSPALVRMVGEAFARTDHVIEVVTSFDEVESKLERAFSLAPTVIPSVSPELLESMSDEAKEERKKLEGEYNDFFENIIEEIPLFSLFQEEVASLPDTIVLEGLPSFRGQAGARGARNFVRAAGIDTKILLEADDRRRATLIRTANTVINQELGKYWSQQFGNRQKITLEVEFSRYPSDHAQKPGAPYLSFWVSEGAERFYPSQRSRGTRWFVSMFLHLLATEREKDNYVVLLDEPGSFLHARAQEDVRLLIERISTKCPVIYSTHIPALVDFTKPYRVLAVERSGDGELSDTQIYQALKVATASRETLSPILEKMGADMRHQAVIKQEGNVLLEEPSAHFYLRAFERLIDDKESLSYVPASGVNNVPVMFALMVAWGLRFAVLLDDDKQGREVRKELVKNYFGDDVHQAEKVIHRIRDCDGIEDVFSRGDFFGVVLQGRHGASGDRKNSQAAKEMRVQKPVVAYEFFIRVERGEISKADLSNETIERFGALLVALKSKSI